MNKTIGINQRISINVIDMAMQAALKGFFTPEYAADLASGEYTGQNRINKARSIIGRLTQRNPLFDYIYEHKDEYMNAIRYAGDKAIIHTALINAAYNFGYDATLILGKFFHVQDEVSSRLLTSKLSAIYSSNRSLPNALYCVMPMYIEAGLINRPKVGVYTKNEIEITTSFAKTLYLKSFIVNNPMLREEDCEDIEHPYFEFISGL